MRKKKKERKERDIEVGRQNFTEIIDILLTPKHERGKMTTIYSHSPQRHILYLRKIARILSSL
jgi:hypothetical protein